MKQGEVWQVGAYKVLVVSADDFNDLPGAIPVVVPLVREHGQAIGPYLVATGQPDNVTGMFLIPEVQPTPDDSGERITTITGATMSRVVTGLQTLLSY